MGMTLSKAKQERKYAVRKDTRRNKKNRKKKGAKYHKTTQLISTFGESKCKYKERGENLCCVGQMQCCREENCSYLDLQGCVCAAQNVQRHAGVKIARHRKQSDIDNTSAEKSGNGDLSDLLIMFVLGWVYKSP